jgi:stage II sporulation protein M
MPVRGLAGASFAAGLLLGVLYPSQQIASEVTREFSRIMELSDLEAYVFVLSNNVQVSALLFALGLLVIPALVLLGVNGYVVGTISAVALGSGIPLSAVVLSLAPHGIIEVYALILSATSSSRLLFTRDDPSLKLRLARSLSELSLSILLLAVAAAVEVFVTPRLSGLL